MSIVVSLREFVFQMEASSNEVSVVLNRCTGEFLAMTDEDIAAAEDDDPKADESLPDWQREIMPKIREAIDSDDWLALPSKFDLDEYRIIEEFCSSVDDDSLRHELLATINGSGAFRRFKQMIKARGIENDWYQFRDQALRQVAMDWLEANAIKFGD